MSLPRYLRSNRALVAFDVIGHDTDAVMGWQFEYPTVTIGIEHEYECDFREVLGRYKATAYTLTLESRQARGIWIPRPTWMDEDLPTTAELNPPRQELPQ